MIIQKFGGMAMQSEASRKHCILHIRNAIRQYNKAVIVVSAMGRAGDAYATDTLITLTSAFKSDSKAKDLVAACGEMIAAAVISAELERTGIENKLLYGQSIGLETSENFGDAEVQAVHTSAIEKALDETSCVIIPGFQGTTAEGDITTLGRGGSDLTAALLGAALKAQFIEYYKDVPGVMTYNPKENADAVLISKLTYPEFHQLLNNSHPIVQKKAAETAEQHHLTLHIRNTFSMDQGTLIVPAIHHGSSDILSTR
ncbi:aspartate kinase [Viridibacillus sp. YIM B01967]|uniref:aspartate kinase n=2 Tax=Viridibacillus soli TaxID=2798301 RepID=A0ABS1H807_9BACL|nr:aspartate kinase [Viridibacillus soli]